MASFQKRGNAWRAIIRKGEYRDNPLTQTFDSKKEAELWAITIESEIANKTHRRKTEHTMHEALVKYRDEHAINNKGAEFEIVRLNKFLETLKFLDKSMSEISEADIIGWRNTRLKDQRLKNKNLNLYVAISPATVRREFNILSSVFTTARKEWRWIKHNPCDDVDRPQSSKPRFKRINDDVIQQFVDYLGFIDGEPVISMRQQVAAIFLFAMETTMRRSEICGLLRSKTNFKEHFTVVENTKNGERKFVPLSARAEELLLQLQTGDDLFFTVRPRYVTDTIKVARKALGITDVKFHDSRHESSTRLAKIFTNPADLAKITGHKDINTLINVYYNPDARELADRLRGDE